MNTLINMNEIFNSMDTRRAAAEAFIARYSDEQVKEAHRVAKLYSGAHETSISGVEGCARQLVEIYGQPARAVV